MNENESRATPPSPSTAQGNSVEFDGIKSLEFGELNRPAPPLSEDDLAAFEKARPGIHKHGFNEGWRGIVLAAWEAGCAALSSRPAGEVELPPLPRMLHQCHPRARFSADQLRAYGQECARAAVQPQAWPVIPRSFHDWWDADCLTQTNPFREDSPAYWAWEGWTAALAAKPVSIDAEEVASVIEGALVEDVLPYHSPEWIARAQALLAKLKS